MSASPTPPNGTPRHRVLDGPAAVRALVDSLRTRIISGLILALPIALTFWIIYQLYLVLNNAILDPASRVVRVLLGYREGFDPNGPWARYISPLIAVVLVGGLLYMLGLFARTGLRRALDWVLLRLPGVTMIYKALSNVFQSLEGRRPGRLVQAGGAGRVPPPRLQGPGLRDQDPRRRLQRPDDPLRLRPDRRRPPRPGSPSTSPSRASPTSTGRSTRRSSRSSPAGSARRT